MSGFCEGDLHYRELCTAPRPEEVVFDIKDTVNPTHGWFATHLHDELWPRIVLRDMGIGGLAAYVGYCETDWFTKRDQDLNSGSRPVGQGMPPKLLFCNEFLNVLPTYFHGDEQTKQPVGRLLWYMTIQVVDQQSGRIEMFVNCTMQGHRFVWNLRKSKELGSCEKGCHTIGLWRD